MKTTSFSCTVGRFHFYIYFVVLFVCYYLFLLMALFILLIYLFLFFKFKFFVVYISPFPLPPPPPLPIMVVVDALLYAAWSLPFSMTIAVLINLWLDIDDCSQCQRFTTPIKSVSFGHRNCGRPSRPAVWTELPVVIRLFCYRYSISIFKSDMKR